MDNLQERFERWAHEDEGIALSLLVRHPTPDRAMYLNAIVDGMWRGFKGYHDLARRADVQFNALSRG